MYLRSSESTQDSGRRLDYGSRHRTNSAFGYALFKRLTNDDKPNAYGYVDIDKPTLRDKVIGYSAIAFFIVFFLIFLRYYCPAFFHHTRVQSWQRRLSRRLSSSWTSGVGIGFDDNNESDDERKKDENAKRRRRSRARTASGKAHVLEIGEGPLSRSKEAIGETSCEKTIYEEKDENHIHVDSAAGVAAANLSPEDGAEDTLNAKGEAGQTTQPTPCRNRKYMHILSPITFRVDAHTRRSAQSHRHGHKLKPLHLNPSRSLFFRNSIQVVQSRTKQNSPRVPSSALVRDSLMIAKAREWQWSDFARSWPYGGSATDGTAGEGQAAGGGLKPIWALFHAPRLAQRKFSLEMRGKREHIAPLKVKAEKAAGNTSRALDHRHGLHKSRDLAVLSDAGADAGTDVDLESEAGSRATEVPISRSFVGLPALPSQALAPLRVVVLSRPVSIESVRSINSATSSMSSSSSSNSDPELGRGSDEATAETEQTDISASTALDTMVSASSHDPEDESVRSEDDKILREDTVRALIRLSVVSGRADVDSGTDCGSYAWNDGASTVAGGGSGYKDASLRTTLIHDSASQCHASASLPSALSTINKAHPPPSSGPVKVNGAHTRFKSYTPGSLSCGIPLPPPARAQVSSWATATASDRTSIASTATTATAGGGDGGGRWSRLYDRAPPSRVRGTAPQYRATHPLHASLPIPLSMLSTIYEASHGHSTGNVPEANEPGLNARARCRDSAGAKVSECSGKVRCSTYLPASTPDTRLPAHTRNESQAGQHRPNRDRDSLLRRASSYVRALLLSGSSSISNFGYVDAAAQPAVQEGRASIIMSTGSGSSGATGRGSWPNSHAASSDHSGFNSGASSRAGSMSARQSHSRHSRSASSGSRGDGFARSSSCILHLRSGTELLRFEMMNKRDSAGSTRTVRDSIAV